MDAALLRTIKPDPERIVEIDHMAAIFNSARMLRDRKFIVILGCGHKVYTRAQNRTVCPRCTEMLRRSIEDGQEDYDSFRKGLTQDRMVWRDDPLRQFNEPTDLAGNFTND